MKGTVIRAALRRGAALFLIAHTPFEIHSHALAESYSPEAALAEIQAMLPESPEWDEWVSRTQAYPPRFDILPSLPVAPDPLLRFPADPSSKIAALDEWEAHVEERLRHDVQHYLMGRLPDAPQNLEAEVIGETVYEGAASRRVRLTFGPGQAAALGLELIIPEGEGPFPVFMTQHNHRAWGLVAVKRGYIACIYNGSDSSDDTATFVEPYSGYNWTKLARRGWAASRCIDYLETVPEADAARVALTGHSRNGKTSLMAAAFDPRIQVVISSSSGQGGCLTAREFSEQHFGEGLELITRRFPDWLHPRLRFFVGREDKLPVDFHTLVALCAPRAVLLAAALNDPVESTWAIERTYAHVLPVFELFGKPEALAIRYRAGNHATNPGAIESYLDWCDFHFGRAGTFAASERIHPYDWDSWAAASDFDPGAAARVRKEAVDDPVQHKAETRAAVLAVMGDAPRGAGPLPDYGEEPFAVEALLGREGRAAGLVREDLVFGEYVNADLWRPRNSDGAPLPAVLWLPPISNARGYMESYRRGAYAFEDLARAGFAVMCFDPIGMGNRIEEVQGFYRRHPNWSLLGKHVRDAQDAIGVLMRHEGVDARRVYVVGFAQGAFIGAHLAVLDERPAGYALISPAASFAAGPETWAHYALMKWSHHQMLAPALGHWKTTASLAPYDMPDLYAAIAPSPLLLVTPEHNWEAPLGAMKASVERAERSYAAQEKGGLFTWAAPPTYNHFGQPTREIVIEWLQEQAGIAAH